MFHPLPSRCAIGLLLSAVLIAIAAPPATAQVREVVVGLTPYCSEGLAGCWQTAHNALPCLDGVKAVASYPDTYNCTVALIRKDSRLPDCAAWAAQLRSAVGGIYTFRGVEITVDGTVEKRDASLVLVIPGIATPVQLKALEHKLQWNFKAHAAREPEPHEAAAFADLRVRLNDTKDAKIHVQITGPLPSADGPLEVREWFSNGEQPPN